MATGTFFDPKTFENGVSFTIDDSESDNYYTFTMNIDGTLLITTAHRSDYIEIYDSSFKKIKDVYGSSSVRSVSLESGTYYLRVDSSDSSSVLIYSTAMVIDSVKDTTAPTASITLSDTVLSIGETAMVSIAFSEAVSGFTSSDVVASNGAISNFTTSDNKNWTATFTPTENISSSSNTIAITSGSATDNAGNSNTSASSGNYTVDTKDTTAPTASITLSDTVLSIGETATVSIAFSEAVSGFTSSDVVASNGAISNFTTSDNKNWTATFTPTENISSSSNTIAITSGSATDNAGNSNTSASSGNYTVDTKDTTAPTATISLSDTALTIGETATIGIKFSEAVTGFGLDDMSVGDAQLSNLTTTDNISWTATLTPDNDVESNGNSVLLATSSYTDTTGNKGQSASSAKYDIDTINNTPPKVNDILFSIMEGLAVNSKVSTIEASDDEGDELTYSITSGNLDLNGNGQSAFKIDSITGDLLVNDKGDLNYEQQSSFLLMVKVSDGELSDTATASIQIQNVTEKAQKLKGTAKADQLYGGEGNDTITGNAGDDKLAGSLGKDKLTGGAGKDQFIFNTALGSSNVDTIVDFTAKTDKIVLDRDIFAEFDTSSITSNQFYAGKTATKAHDADDRIIYNTSTGKLYYDADGDEVGSAVQIAVIGVSKHSMIYATDFSVI